MKAKNAIILAAGWSRRMGPLTRDFPKYFLPIAGRRMIEYALDLLDQQGFELVTFVVGHKSEVVKAALGDRYRSLRLQYVLAAEYLTNGHGWSLCLAKDAWRAHRGQLLLLHADAYFHPQMVTRVLDDPRPNAMAVDERWPYRTGDEVVALGSDDVVTGFGKGLKKEEPGILGELVGIHSWSEPFAEEVFAYLDAYFRRESREPGYEPVMDLFLKQTAQRLHSVRCGELPWINMNYPEDYEQVKNELHPAVYGARR